MPRRPTWRAGMVVPAVLLGAVLLLTGCFQLVTGPNYSTGIEAGPAWTVNMRVKMTVDAAGDRPVLAFRYPAGWEVSSAAYAGDFSGTFTPSAVIANYFATTWEAKAADKSHNGPKSGYSWWAGYGGAHDLTTGQETSITLVVNTHGVAGTFALDFVGGVAVAAAPEDASQNGDGGFWEIGGSYDHDDPAAEPLGVALNQAVTLTPAQDPAVEAVTPANGATGVGIEVKPRVKFSEDMDAATLTATQVFVRKTGSAVALPAANFYNLRTHELIIDLNDPLEYNTDYIVFVDGTAADKVGYTLGADFISAFRTAAEPTAPTVTETFPAAGATGVSLDANITAAFDQPMNPATLTTDTFLLKPADNPGGPAVPAVVTYNGATNTALLDPVANLEPATEYRATLTATVAGANGLALAAPVTWTFTTGNAVAFIDVPPGSPYYLAIEGMAEAGIINGYPAGGGFYEFRPANPVWRWQFAKMVVGALSLPIDESKTSPFTDLDPDNPSQIDQTEYVAVAWENGVTRGLTSTTFGPYRNISRAQVISMVVRALQTLHPGLLANPPAGYHNTWGTGFSADHGPNARLAEFNGLLANLPLTTTASDPWAPMPRGEVAQVLWNMMGLLP